MGWLTRGCWLIVYLDAVRPAWAQVPDGQIGNCVTKRGAEGTYRAATVRERSLYRNLQVPLKPAPRVNTVVLSHCFFAGNTMRRGRNDGLAGLDQVALHFHRNGAIQQVHIDDYAIRGLLPNQNSLRAFQRA